MRRYWETAALAWFWLVVGLLLWSGWWPGAEWGSLILWLGLSVGLYSLFEFAAFLVYDLPDLVRRLPKLG